MWIMVFCCKWNISAKNNAMESTTGSFKEVGGGLPMGCGDEKKKLLAENIADLKLQ